ncbi:Methionine aminopeptidase [uncultured Eubacteriales bacterium]|uniref:Methionine aminopeptidase n=1 Tax=uncultured Eubacteriales bacterium TaxID=172733 RepID=A0A212KFS6_9FIRM|nr:Methionine aminopeptidase [uncultured Eubacteriales bacterium]
MEIISIKSPREIELMRHAGRITAAARKLAGELVKPGVTTLEIDTAVRKFIESQGAKPSFLNYNGFPGSACLSVNDEIIHGIPGHRTLREGDIVSVDVGAVIDGYHGDCAGTYPCGHISEEAARLIAVTEQSFWAGMEFARAGCRVSDISHAIQVYAETNGCSLVREYVGHGVGRKLHEPPEVPNYGPAGHGVRLQPGMTLAVEPMVNAGAAGIRVLKDGWTVKTADGSLSAHYENSILITEDGGPEILTALENG